MTGTRNAPKRLTQLNSNLRNMKNQFDYASLIERNFSEKSRSTEQSEISHKQKEALGLDRFM